MFFGLSIYALTGSGVTEDETTTAASGPDEAVRTGGVMSISSLLLWTSPSSPVKNAQTQ